MPYPLPPGPSQRAREPTEDRSARGTQNVPPPAGEQDGIEPGAPRDTDPHQTQQHQQPHNPGRAETGTDLAKPPTHHDAPPDHFFRNPGDLPADHCDARHTVQPHERIMHPGLQPVGPVVVRLGNRAR
jgi:hypothetical protein